jgi:hypothetical protein
MGKFFVVKLELNQFAKQRALTQAYDQIHANSRHDIMPQHTPACININLLLQALSESNRNFCISFYLRIFIKIAIHHLVALVLLIILVGQQIFPATEYLAQYLFKLFMTKIKLRFYH